ncbi:MAG: DNA mismatch repair endonuclease MutL [Hyphomonadaceae bacterium]
MPDSSHSVPSEDSVTAGSSAGVRIRRLPADAVNKIAAGEVVERPAAAVKELVENALDAGATSIRVRIERGGLQALIVEDDGSGMSAAELSVAVERHATSKLAPDDAGQVDLLDIRTMGFRGEALPSIGSVSRMKIETRSRDASSGSSISVEGGEVSEVGPCAWTGRSDHGCRVEVRDLFFATPARLKFLKSERSEAQAVGDVVKRLALARPDVAFVLESEERVTLKLPAEMGDPVQMRLARLGAVLGKEFRENALEIDAERDGVQVYGFAGLPTFNRGSAQHQYLFVNGRPVKDRMLTGVIRAAYQDFLARDRHPMAALFVELDPHHVDVNVHPAKTEVRFRDSAGVRGLLIGALRHALAAAGHRASTTVAGAALGSMRPETSGVSHGLPWARTAAPSYAGYSARSFEEPAPGAFEPSPLAPDTLREAVDALSAPSTAEGLASEAYEGGPPPLGLARAQLHETYIVSQTRDGMVIVDQHAAHERLVYERMKAAMAANGVQRQSLLIPEIVELSEVEAERVCARAGEFLAFGLELEPFGKGAVAVRATPALFGVMDVAGLVRDLADDLAEYDSSLSLTGRFEEIMGSMACRGSVRARRLPWKR